MRQVIISAALVATTLVALPATAQDKTDPTVQSYLCTFAGKCDSGAGGNGDAAPTMAAPATKGFRIAGPQVTAPAPATKGFRIIGQPAVAATATQGRGYRAGRQAARTTAPRMASRSSYVAARPAPTPGVGTGAGIRADLMLGFGYNSDRMTSLAESKARGFAKALLMPELAGKRFLIEGHTDARGKRDFNVDLSRRRAQSVADFLVAQGVDRTRVEVKGVGPDEPLPGRSANAEANRRVEAVLIG